ncbi:MAG: enoyl-CoA hydratase/isomerase family protein [Candidatus Thermoplasmatota archaeon]|nr:enoyl-CoA hydratase/isomerase family protein [Candidatus Thermoplasmatota archaeon]
MNYDTIDFKIIQNVAHITLNRPERVNSFDIKLGEELLDALNEIKKQNQIRAVVIKGTGKGFCGGGDVKEMYLAKDKSIYLRQLTKIIHKCVMALRDLEKPVIAGVNGAAYGAGLSFALACDIIIAVKGAKMNTAFIGIGLAPGCGTQFFTKIVGYQRACEYIMLSKTFDAEKAKEMGLVNDVVDEKNLDLAINEIVEKFKKLPPIAVGKAKMLINESLENDIATHLDLESVTAAYTAGTKDFKEGITAFVEKRKPVFIGK